MKIEGYEKISRKEYEQLPADEGVKIDDAYKQKDQYFKKAQKFPIVFEGEFKTFSITEDGFIEIQSKTNEKEFLCINKDFPLLVKTVEKAKEVMKKNEKK